MSKLNKTKVIITLITVAVIVAISSVGNFYCQRLFYPRRYSEHVERYAKEFCVPEHIVYAVIFVESGFDPSAHSEAGACGLMQLMPKTYSWLAKERQEAERGIYNEEENIKYGTLYLSMLYKKYEDWTLTFCAYNAGTGNVDKWLENKPFKIQFPETKNYVNKIEVAVDKYESLYY